MFLPIQYDSGKLVKMKVAAATFNKGDAMVDDGNGHLTAAAASCAVDVHYVAMETKASAPTAGDFCLMIKTEGVDFTADTDAAPAQTDMLTYCDLATVATVDPNGSTYDIFFLESIVGATTDKKVRGRFATGVPNS